MTLEKKFICDYRECSGEDMVIDIRPIRIARMNPWEPYYTFHLCTSCSDKFTELIDNNIQNAKEKICPQKN